MSALADNITKNATLLLMIAVIVWAITLLFDVVGTTTVILGDINLMGDNLIEIDDSGGLFAFIGALCFFIYNLFAGLSFAAVCFDEEKNIWFRVVSVAALIIIIWNMAIIGA